MTLDNLILIGSLLANTGLFGWMYKLGTNHGTRISVLEAMQTEKDTAMGKLFQAIDTELREIKSDIKNIILKLPTMEHMAESCSMFVNQSEYTATVEALERRVDRLERTEDAKPVTA